MQMEFQVGDAGMVQRLGKATQVRGCKCCAVLCKGLEYLSILISVGCLAPVLL